MKESVTLWHSCLWVAVLSLESPHSSAQILNVTISIIKPDDVGRFAIDLDKNI
jgi:hypothetical protein